jgi:hypothetical protein
MIDNVGSDLGILNSIIMGDEMGVTFSMYCPNIKPHTGCCPCHPESRCYVQATQEGKTLLELFLDRVFFTTSLFWKSITSTRLYTEAFYAVCEKHSTINVSIFGNLETNCSTAPAHRSFFVQEYLTKNGTSVLPHYPCSSDLGLADNCQSPKMKVL